MSSHPHEAPPIPTVAELRALLEGRGLRPRRALGQNFLIDANLVRKLVDASGVRPGDVVLEVGPGAGSLTVELLRRGACVIACELDPALAALLRERLTGACRDDQGDLFTLIEGDCLASKRALNADMLDAVHTAMRARDRAEFHLVANLPYGAASPLMLNLLAAEPACAGMSVTIQKEVADRLMASSGTRDYGELTVIAQALADIARIATVPPSCFWPAPKVTSAMVALTRRMQPLTQDIQALMRLCDTLFQKRRKQIGAILGRGAPLPPGVDPSARPEQLDVATLVALSALQARSA